jgi:hypothetical protein
MLFKSFGPVGPLDRGLQFLTQSPDGYLHSINALSGHGALVAYETATEEGGGAPTPGTGFFTTVAELGDITPPSLMRNEFDATTQQEDIDSYVLGVLRRSAVTIKMNFIPTNGTHDHLTGVYKMVIDDTRIGWRFTFPGSWIWIASGQVKEVVPHAPVDGKMEADLTLRFSGRFFINGVLIG